MHVRAGYNTASSESASDALFFGAEAPRDLNPSSQQSSGLHIPRPKDGWGAEIAAWCCAASFMVIWIVGFVQVAEWLAKVFP